MMTNYEVAEELLNMEAGLPEETRVRVAKTNAVYIRRLLKSPRCPNKDFDNKDFEVKGPFLSRIWRGFFW